MRIANRIRSQVGGSVDPIVVVITAHARRDSVRALELVAILMQEIRARLGRTSTKREWMPILGVRSAFGGSKRGPMEARDMASVFLDLDPSRVSPDAGWLRAAQVIGGLLLFLGLLAAG